MRKNLFLKTLVAVSILALNSCAGLHFSQEALTRDQNIAKSAQSLISKAGEDYDSHQADVTAFKKQVDDAITAEKTRCFNHITLKMFEAVTKAKGNIYDLLDLWKTQKKLSVTFIQESMPEADRLLKSISDFEDYKIKKK